MSLYGYARGFDPRLGSLDPASCPQGRRLRGYSCGEGARGDGRQVLLDFLPAGDTLVVTRIDRPARLLKDLQGIVHELKARGVALKATGQPAGTAAGKAFFDMLGVFAEFETNLHRERQLEGITAAKARCLQGPPAVDRCRRGAAAAPRGKAGPLGDRTPARHRPGQRLSPDRQTRGGRCGERRWGCRSDVSCASSIRATGCRSVGRSGSSGPPAPVRVAAGRTG